MCRLIEAKPDPDSRVQDYLTRWLTRNNAPIDASQRATRQLMLVDVLPVRDLNPSVEARIHSYPDLALFSSACRRLKQTRIYLSLKNGLVQVSSIFRLVVARTSYLESKILSIPLISNIYHRAGSDVPEPIQDTSTSRYIDSAGAVELLKACKIISFTTLVFNISILSWIAIHIDFARALAYEEHEINHNLHLCLLLSSCLYVLNIYVWRLSNLKTSSGWSIVYFNDMSWLEENRSITGRLYSIAFSLHLICWPSPLATLVGLYNFLAQQVSLALHSSQNRGRESADITMDSSYESQLFNDTEIRYWNRVRKWAHILGSNFSIFAQLLRLDEGPEKGGSWPTLCLYMSLAICFGSSYKLSCEYTDYYYG